MKVNEMMIKDLKEATKINQNTGKYVNAQKFGRNITIGVSVIIIGILYSIYGLTTVLIGLGAFFGLLFVISAMIYIAIKSRMV